MDEDKSLCCCHRMSEDIGKRLVSICRILEKTRNGEDTTHIYLSDSL